jgi:hypothetical protein
MKVAYQVTMAAPKVAAYPFLIHPKWMLPNKTAVKTAI